MFANLKYFRNRKKNKFLKIDLIQSFYGVFHLYISFFCSTMISKTSHYINVKQRVNMSFLIHRGQGRRVGGGGCAASAACMGAANNFTRKNRPAEVKEEHLHKGFVSSRYGADGGYRLANFSLKMKLEAPTCS